MSLDADETDEPSASIRIPPSSAYLATVRAFVGAIGRHCACSEEAVEDLRLATTEACAQAIEDGVATDGIDVRAWVLGDRLRMEVEPAGAIGSRSTDRDSDAPPDVRRALITALDPEATFADAGGHLVVRLSVPADGR
ncbi:MAG TPA: ATP-binding protein [Actinomycetota bacterium]|jgi:anti-sigma regulatory factor (Ser/Thr protein kinase)